MSLRLQTFKQPSFDYEDFEPKLQQRIFKELPKIDYLHTIQVVKNMKRYVSMQGGKYDILVTAAYLHEVGKGDKTIILSHELNDISPLLQKCAVNAKRAREILDSIGFPTERGEAVYAYLCKGECFELKRAHHSQF